MGKYMNREDRIERFISLWDTYSCGGMAEELVAPLEMLGFFDAPASTKYHGAYDGGLFDHSFAVAEALVELTGKLNLQWDREISPVVIGLLHDLCKCDSYIKLPDGGYKYNDSMLLSGHGDKSVIVAQSIFDLTDEEILCIRWHMGAFDDKSVWGNYTAAIKKYPNVLYTHTADMIAAHVKDV